MDEFKFGKTDLRFLVRLKARDFKKHQQRTITEKQIQDYLFNVKWKKRDQMPMYEIIDDIMSLDSADVFDYLSVQVIKEANQMCIQDFNDLISR